MARGSITPRPTKDGKIRYRIKWESRGPDGKRRHHSATCTTKKAAEMLLAEKLSAVDNGTFVQATKETVGEYLVRWLSAESSRLSGASVYGYNTTIQNRILPYLGTVPMARLDELAIQGCYAQLLAAGYSVTSVRQAHKVLHAALKQAVAWRLLPRNPVDGVKAPPAVSPTPAVWSADEAALFLESTASDRYAALWRLGLDTGMRLGEMLALTWRDIDMDRGMVSVRRTITRKRHGGWTLGDLAKTSSSRRSILLGAATVAALRSHRARQAARRLSCGASWVDLGLIFDRGDGNALNPAVPRRAFYRAVESAGLPRLTPHGMRHTMATLLLGAGVHPKIVQERLGHASVQMTLDRYSHVSMTMQQDATAVLNQILTSRARPERGHDAI